MNKISYWLNNARAVALPQSLFPAIVALCLAAGQENFSLGLGIIAVAGVLSAHLSVNLLDDYFDYKNDTKNTREKLAAEGEIARTGKSPYLYSGEVSPKKLFVVASCFAAFSLILGGIICLKQGFFPIIIALIAGFLGFFYSAEPLKLCYRGLGELVTGIIFGPLLMIGVFYSATGTLSAEIRYASAIVGLLVMNILFTHSIMDFKPDSQVGKKTLAGVLKDKNLILICSAIFNFLPYCILLIALIIKQLPAIYAVIFIILPLSIYLYFMIWHFCNHTDKIFTKKWWMGPMENWKAIEESNMQWFALRWYLSRNVLQFVCILLIICAFL